VLKWAGNFFLMIALLAATDAQWMVLQSVAWAGMIVSYSEKSPLKMALAETFDGKRVRELPPGADPPARLR